MSSTLSAAASRVSSRWRGCTAFTAAHHRVRHDPADHHGVRGERAHAGLRRRARHHEHRRGHHDLPHQPGTVPPAHGAGADVQLRASAAQGRPVLAAPVLARPARLHHLVRDLLRGGRAFSRRLPVCLPARPGERGRAVPPVLPARQHADLPAVPGDPLGAEEDRGVSRLAVRPRARLPGVADRRAALQGRAAGQRPHRAVPERRRARLLDRHLRPVRGGGRARGLALRATVRLHPAAPAQRVARRARGGPRRGRRDRRVPDRDRGLRRDAEQRERRLPAGRHLRGARLRLGAARRRAAVERPGRAAA